MIHPTLRRRRLLLLDHLVKRNALRSIVVAGVDTDEECKGLLQWSKQAQFVLVWTPGPVRGPSDRIRQQHALGRMRAWQASYQRFEVIEASTAEAVKQLDGRQFDCVALWGLSPAQLAAEGPSWAMRVKDGGLLVGVDHRQIEVRRILNAAVPQWDTLRDGVWCVRVKRSAPTEEVSGAGVAEADSHAAADEPDVDLVGGQAHDPVDSRSDADDAVQGRAPVGGAEDELSRRAAIEHVEDKGISLGEGELGDPLVGVTDIGIGSRDLAQRSAVNSNGEQPVRASASPEPAAPPAVGGSELHADTIAQPAPKRRGRPPGSKNRAPGVAAARGRKAATP